MIYVTLLGNLRQKFLEFTEGNANKEGTDKGTGLCLKRGERYMIIVMEG